MRRWYCDWPLAIDDQFHLDDEEELMSSQKRAVAVWVGTRSVGLRVFVLQHAKGEFFAAKSAGCSRCQVCQGRLSLPGRKMSLQQSDQVLTRLVGFNVVFLTGQQPLRTK